MQAINQGSSVAISSNEQCIGATANTPQKSEAPVRFYSSVVPLELVTGGKSSKRLSKNCWAAENRIGFCNNCL